MNIVSRTAPPLLALRAFESAGRLGTMTAASHELCVTPGAVSRQVRLLEDYLGVALFTGPKNKPVLTSQGSALLMTVSNAMSQIIAGVNAVKSNTQNVLNVSCLNTFAMRCLIPRLYRFNAAYPDIDVRLSTSSLDDPLKSNYDVVINVRDNKRLDHRTIPLFPEMLGPVIAPKLADEYEIVFPRDLSDKPVLKTRTRPDAWSRWCTSMNLRDMPFKAGSVFEHYYFAIEAALGGLGICIAPQHLVEDEINAGRLISPFGFKPSGYTYIADVLSESNQAAKHFVSWLQGEIGSS
ncbi:MAG: LysR substrate-binding domain-containing protein [Halopseudomonas aestusnigri]